MKQLEEKILKYCSAEGISRYKLPANEKLEFGYNLDFPPNHPKPKRITILQPKDKLFVILQIGIKISDEHLKVLEKKSPNSKMIYFEMLRRTLLSKNLMFKMEMNHNRFLISEQIYDDGLTMDAFYRNIRKIFNASDTCNLILTDMTSGRGPNIPPDNQSKEESTNNDNSFDNLYYS